MNNLPTVTIDPSVVCVTAVPEFPVISRNEIENNVFVWACVITKLAFQEVPDPSTIILLFEPLIVADNVNNGSDDWMETMTVEPILANVGLKLLLVVIETVGNVGAIVSIYIQS